MLDDLLGQLEQQERTEIQAGAANLAQAEQAAITLVERLRAQGDSSIQLFLAGGFTLSGLVSRPADGWVLIATGEGQECLVRTSAILTVGNLGRKVSAPSSEIGNRLGLGHALRRIAAARRPVVVWLTDGRALEGTIERVGADHLDLSGPPADELARKASGVTILFAGLAAVSSSRNHS